MYETTMDQEREAPLDQLEAWDFEADDENLGYGVYRDHPLGAAIPTTSIPTASIPSSISDISITGPTAFR
jgi:hypothetical protein